MIKLDAVLTLPSGDSIKAGTLVVSDPDEISGELLGQFQYAPGHLDFAKAFPLDPLNLPLSMEIFNADRPRTGVHGVFEDSLPDDWGRKLMVRRYKLRSGEQRVPQLLRLLGNQGLGALSYADKGLSRTITAGVSIRHLRDLALLAERFDRTPAAVTDDDLSLLFQAGSSPGGARPKALVKDEYGSYLAKFASTRDQLDIVGLEASAMELARRAGIKTAETRIYALGTRKCLLVKRFDLTDTGGRNHMISMQSLLKAEGYYYAGYRDLADIIRHVSVYPKKDLHALYRQMVFNVMIGNTDDHLKNFIMLHDDEGWKLSPAFDLVPNIGFNREHVLRIGYDNFPPDYMTLLNEAAYFGLKRKQKAQKMIVEIREAVLNWCTVFAESGVPKKDINLIGKDIAHRLKLTSPSTME